MAPSVTIRCTANILKLLGSDAPTGCPATPDETEWYMKLLWLDGRKCVLLTHAETLFSVFAPDVSVQALRSIGSFAANLIQQGLDAEGLPRHTFGRLDSVAFQVAKTSDRSVMGCMNELGHQCRFEVEDAGGLGNCDIRALNQRLRRTILGPLGSSYPIDLARQRAHGSTPSPAGTGTLGVCGNCGAPNPWTSIEREPQCDRCADKRIARHTGLPELPDPPGPIVLTDVDGCPVELRFRLRRAATGIEMELEDANLEPRQGIHLAVLGSHDGDVAELETRLVQMAEAELGQGYLVPNHHREGWILAEEHDELRGRLVWHEGNDVGTPYDVVIDGKTLSWEELGRALEPYEGWRFVLRLEDPSEDVRPDAPVASLRRRPETSL